VVKKQSLSVLSGKKKEHSAINYFLRLLPVFSVISVVKKQSLSVLSDLSGKKKEHSAINYFSVFSLFSL
jgi:hypothetical protein